MGRKAKASSSKSRVELRLDSDVYAALKSLSDQSGISINQIMQGVTRWAVDNANLGRAWTEEDDHGYPEFRTEECEGCIWFGHGPDVKFFEDAAFEIHPEVHFQLDFTDKRAIMPSIRLPKEGEQK